MHKVANSGVSLGKNLDVQQSLSCYLYVKLTGVNKGGKTDTLHCNIISSSNEDGLY